jgi:hypothetical protein
MSRSKSQSPNHRPEAFAADQVRRMMDAVREPCAAMLTRRNPSAQRLGCA